MTDHPEKEDQRSDDEATERMNRALKRALSTPPKPKIGKAPESIRDKSVGRGRLRKGRAGRSRDGG